MSYPPAKGRSATCYSPVRHFQEQPKFLLHVRLACIRHAASVHPEPGSNSPSRMLDPCLTSKGEFVYLTCISCLSCTNLRKRLLVLSYHCWIGKVPLLPRYQQKTDGCSPSASSPPRAHFCVSACYSSSPSGWLSVGIPSVSLRSVSAFPRS